MPVSYQIPNWIKPAETARDYLSGVQIGVNVAQQQQSLQAQRERTAMEMEMRQKELERRMAEETQRLMMTKAYHDQVIGLREKQLQDQAAENQAQTAQITQRVLAQEEYRRRVAGGEDAAKVMMELGPVMGAESALGSVLRGAQQQAGGPLEAYPVTLEGKRVPGLISVPTGTGGSTTRELPGYRPPGPAPSERSAAASYLKSQRSELAATLTRRPQDPESAKIWTQRNKSTLDEMARLDQQIRELLPALRGASGGEGVRQVRRNPQTGKLELSPATAAPRELDLQSHDLDNEGYFEGE